MCTVVCRWAPDDAFAIHILALRDELASRDFDGPGEWWPEHPGVIGGRDRTAGGSWCVSDIASGVTAVVLNRPEKRTAEAGAPSRGVLPLLAVQHRGEWTDHVIVAGMASFILVLAEPDALTSWSFDGDRLERRMLDQGTYVFTPRGLASAVDDQRFPDRGGDVTADGTRSTEETWPQWLRLVTETPPSTDPTGLIVCLPVGEQSYETVFGQFIAATPGLLRLDYLYNPARDAHRPWTTRVETA